MDRGWAANVLRQAAEWARVDAAGFVQSVLDGLTLGAQRYGDRDYEGRDNAEGGLFECRDLAAYALMEWADMDNDLHQGVSLDNVQAARMFLGEAMKAAATADTMLRLARKERAEGRSNKRLPALRRQTKGVAP